MISRSRFRVGLLVPLALLAAFASGPAPAADARVLNALLDGVLESHVADGYVDYPAVARNVRFYKYLEAIAEFDAGSLGTDAERLAFWINAYNALAIKMVIEGVTPVNLAGRIKFFRTTEHRVAGQALDLQSIEEDILGALGEPRVYFALAPAAFAGPKLRSESWRADELERQLEDSVRDFVNDKRKNRFSTATYKAKLSKVFERHADVFGEDDGAILEFVARYVAAADIADALTRGTFEIEYMEFDWSINGRPME
jgi:hypothetical protein